MFPCMQTNLFDHQHHCRVTRYIQHNVHDQLYASHLAAGPPQNQHVFTRFLEESNSTHLHTPTLARQPIAPETSSLHLPKRYFAAAEANMSTINPIIPGFAPDPSLVLVNGVYFLVNSTFHLYPGLPIYTSQDLVHWNQIGIKYNPSLMKILS
jgi:hypothetical protein